jgi:hypothetical protein
MFFNLDQPIHHKLIELTKTSSFPIQMDFYQDDILKPFFYMPRNKIKKLLI